MKYPSGTRSDVREACGAASLSANATPATPQTEGSSMIAALKRWLAYWLPTDEQLMGGHAAQPDNHAAIVARMNELEATRAIARRRVEELHNVTGSPIIRRGA
jgi:hypothetical protein